MSVSTMALARRYALPIAFVAGLATAYAVSRSEPQLAASGAAPLNPVVAPATASYANAVDRAAPAVVMISVDKHGQATNLMGFPDDQFFQRFFGPDATPNRQGRNPQPQQGPLETGLGSGVIMTPDGTILTNNHVVEGADHVSVYLHDGREFEAKIVGTDPPSDLAVVRINAANLPAITVADSDKIRVGDVVLAVGNPLGIGETVTMGIISAKGRTTGDESGNSTYEDFLQTDAPINRGNSGGALVTTTGELVGINSQIMSPSGGSIGIGFAIPSNMAEDVMSQLVATGHVRRGMLGVLAQQITSDMAKSLGLASVHGAIVAQVTADSPASAAGLRDGDVILKVNGQSIDDSNDLRNRISAMAPGSKVTLDIQRNGRDESVTATLAEATPTTASETPSTTSKRGEQALGMNVQALTPDLARELRVPAGTTGIVVTGVDDAGAARRAGVQSGDVISQVDGQSVTSTAGLKEALGRHTDRPALLQIQRQGQTLFVALPRN